MSRVLHFFSLFLVVGETWVLVPPLGIELRPTAMKAESPNHWTAMEFPQMFLFLIKGVLPFFLLLFCIH